MALKALTAIPGVNGPKRRVTPQRTTTGTIMLGGKQIPIEIREGKKTDTYTIRVLSQGDQISFEPPEGYIPPKYGYPCGV